MKTLLKCFLSAMLAIVMVVATLPLSVLAVEGEDFIDTEMELADAIAVGGEVVLGGNITVTSGLTVPAGVSVTLDLNGNVLRGVDATAGSSALITNNGTLTIIDSLGGGKLTNKPENPDVAAIPGYASNTISNNGVLTVNSGTVENTADGGACYAIDNYAGSTCNINGGTVTASKTAMRIYTWQGSGVEVTVNISGGAITSLNGYGMTTQITDGDKFYLSISGGTITTSRADYPLAVYVNRTVKDSKVNITGGIFNGLFAMNSQASESMVAGSVSITGGTFSGVSISGTPACDFISGGTFGVDVSEYVAEGYTVKALADGTYKVVTHDEAAVAQVGETKYLTLQEAIEAAEATSGTVVLLDDVTLADETLKVNGTVVLDLNGKTIIGVPETAAAYAVIQNKGNLTIKGEGTILCDYKLAGSTSYAVNAILNAGTLTINGGTIENRSSATAPQIGYAIDNNSTSANVSVTVNGGSVKASGSAYYDGIRLFCNSEKNTNAVTVNGGTVSSIWLQNPSDNSTGKNTKDVVGSVTVTGGTISTWIQLEPSANFTASISGGVIGEIGYYNTTEGETRSLTGVITGGKFLTEITEKGLIAEGYTVKATADGAYEVVVKEKVAQVGETKYTDLQEALNAGGTVVLLSDVEVTKTLTVNGTVVLDLNGKTVSMLDSSGTTSALIKNSGNLTIKDSVGGGKLTYKSTTPSANNGYATNTITNNGNLVVLSGTIENTTEKVNNGGAFYAIDTAWHASDVTITIKGGTITSTAIAIRQVPYSTTAKSVLNIEGGTISGGSAGVQTFNTSAPANVAEVNISGGVLKGTYAYYTYFSSANGHANTEVNISGGVYDGYVYIYNGVAGSAETEFDVFVTGGTFNGGVYVYTYDAEKNIVAIPAISGGLFAEDVSEYVAEGYAVKALADGTYKVVTHDEAAVAQVGETKYLTLQEAIEAAEATSGTVVLLDDVTLADETLKVNGTVVLDLNGKTIIGVPETAAAYAVIQNKGNLTIKGEGTILCDYKLAGSTGYAVNAILNAGTLTINGGTIENRSSATAPQIGYAIDNNSTSANVSVTVNGGSVKASGSAYYDGIRLFCNSEKNTNAVTVNGGTVSSIWLQNPSDNSTGKNTKDVVGSVTVTGGTISTWIQLEPSANFTASISGGVIGEIGYYNTTEGETRSLTGIITGGKFLTEITEKGLIAEGYTVKATADGAYEVVVKEKVAQVGETKYTDLQEAIEAAEATSGTVVLLSDIEIAETLTVKGTVTLDLAGKTITATDNSTGNYETILVKRATLTVIDSVGGGKISLTASNNRGYNNYSAVISNQGGNVVVSGGELVHNGGTDMAYVIDNNSTLGKTVVTVTGGTLTSPYRAIRAFQNSSKEMNTINVTGGTISARAGIWMHQSGANSLGELEISGGTFSCIANAVVIDIHSGGKSNVNISGGNFSNTSTTANLLLIWPFSDMSTVTEANEAVINITGGTFNCAGEGKLIGILYDAGTKGTAKVTASGGLFSEDISDYVAEGYGIKLVDTYYEVHKHDEAKTVDTATCTEPGVTKIYCSVCDTFIRDGAATEAKGHSFVNGTCSSCSELEEYTVIFKNWDGSVLSEKTYHYGDKVEVPVSPERPSDSAYDYTFAGWDSELEICQGDKVYTAKFTSVLKLNGWQEIDDEWYYYESGVVQTGWLKDGTKWYYMAEDGAMTTGWQKVDGKWYYMANHMLTGWKQIGGKWYYLGTNGAMTTGWQKVDGKWYYLGTNGAMTTGWQQISGKWYYMNANGVMQTGWQKISGKWYYLNNEMKTGWVSVGGKWYYLGTNGAMTTGWQKVSNKWYYMNENGVMQTGWLQLGGKWFYLNSSGVMVTGTQVIGGKTYKFSSGGVWIS